MTIMTVYRGGRRPWDTEDAESMLEYRAAIFAHEDRAVAALYGAVGPMKIDTSNFLDARDPAVRRSLSGDVMRARDHGYAGVIYADDHDWSEDGVETDGAEIAIFSADAFIFE